MNPVQIARGIEKTAKALVSELKLMSREVNKFIFLSLVSERSSFLSHLLNLIAIHLTCCRLKIMSL